MGEKAKRHGHAMTTRLQKGGALLGDMRRLVAAWSYAPASGDEVAFVMKALGKSSLARARDTYIRAFRPRFIEGSPPEAWRLGMSLERADVSSEIAKAFYWWITARSERVLYDYVTEELMEARASVHRRITVDEAMLWLRERLRAEGKEWSSTVTRKVARGMLAALRDFGILQGQVIKSIAPRHCPLEAFTLIAFCLHRLGSGGRALREHADWRLFLFNGNDVERCLLECHQQGWLGFHAAGNICRVDFPDVPFEEYVDAVIGQ